MRLLVSTVVVTSVLSLTAYLRMQAFVLIVFLVGIFVTPIVLSFYNTLRHSDRVYGRVSHLGKELDESLTKATRAVTFSSDASREMQSRMERVTRLIEQTAAIVIGVESDTHTCVPPSTLNRSSTVAEVMLPEVGAFGRGRPFGDAHIAEHKVHLRNEPLRTLKQTRATVAKLLSDVALKLSAVYTDESDVRIDVEGRLRVVTSCTVVIDRALIAAQHTLIVACEEQRTRFAGISPTLAAYSFATNSIHSTDTFPTYEFGEEKLTAKRVPVALLNVATAPERTIAHSGMVTAASFEGRQPAREAFEAFHATPSYEFGEEKPARRVPMNVAAARERTTAADGTESF